MAYLSIRVLQKFVQSPFIRTTCLNRKFSKTTWSIKSIPVTCQESIGDVHKPLGLTFNVTMLDTGRKVMGSTALVIHDNPGDCSTVTNFIEKLDQQGFRVIAPNLPGFGGTQSVIDSDNFQYTHSPAENAELIEILLDLLEINRPDILIGIGAGCGPVTILATVMSTRFRSICLIDPPPPLQTQFPPRVPQLANVPPYLNFTISRLWPLADWFRSFLSNRLLRYIDKSSFPRLSVANNWPGVAVASIITRENCDFQLVHQRAIVLASYSSLPMALVTTCKVNSEQKSAIESVFSLSSTSWDDVDSNSFKENCEDNCLPRNWAVSLKSPLNSSDIDFYQEDEISTLLANIVFKRVNALQEASAEQLCHSVG